MRLRSTRPRWLRLIVLGLAAASAGFAAASVPAMKLQTAILVTV
jgi:hypothetical protein